MNPLQNIEKMADDYVRQLAEETDEYRKSACFKEYLDTMARFWHYSYRNQLLIHVQNRNATRVAGFRKWNELGRKVNAGEKAIKILAPFTKKVQKKDLQEETQTYFCPVNVFDVSQTNGKELPKIDIEIKGDDYKPFLNKLLAYCKQQKIEVEFKELGINGLYGYSKGGKIAIDSKQNTNTQVNTLIHEIAHELTHYSFEGKKFSKQEKEIQAEATVYVVSKIMGFENKSPNYLALYTNDKEKILENFEIISKNTKQILGFVNGVNL